MANTLDALRALYVALGGTAADVADMVIIPDIINAIAALISDQGIAALPTGTDGQILTADDGKWVAADAPTELPAVTADDNGYVLTVVDGEWAKADVPVELPAVTADDNGDVLTVVDGEWAKAALPA